MALPACAAQALGPPLQPERGAPARTTCPRRHSRVEAELAGSRPGSVAASVRAGPPRGVSRGFNSQPLLDEPLKASSSPAGAARTPLFALLPRGRRRRMHDLRRRWDLGSLCRALLTRGLAALGHSLKHVLGAIFSKIFGPLASVGNMDEKSNKLLLALVMLFLFAVIVLQYVCPGTECQLLRLQAFSSPMPDPYRSEDESSSRFVPRYNFSRGDLLRKVDFDIKGDDLIVFLHIQKTGGTTFGRHLVRNIQLEQPCECRVGQKKCTCHRPGKRETWLFSRFSTGWSCGLHADWTELTSCVPAVVDGKRDARLRPSSKDRRGSPNTNPGANSPSSTKARNTSKSGKNFHYITILRDPVSRYLSEWRHVQRGATWKASLHVCDGRPPTSEELPSCYTGDDWSGCPLKEFMDCPYNLANNRQVRMLSDLTLVGCYNLSVMPEKQRNKVLLESAKSNLKHMAFFGLTEFQRKTQYLFEKTFNMNFISPFTQYNTTRASSVEINEEIQKRIEGLNFLDMELYSYAKDLFLQRYQFMRQKEHQEARQKRQEQRKFLKGRFLQTHFQSQGQGQSQNPSQNQSQNPNLNVNQNVTQNLIQNLTQNLSHKENRESQKQNPGQEQSDGNTSNGTNDYIGSVEKWR
ncbi:heparan-sulfate 6-O-sulfotransferase 2 isoform 2-T2 [Lycaon pictus]|uniref:Heparan-sulfate 6-O-sulfotransferase n=2 Tax=Canis lupus familiaris TaxID=9615 RepID=A0A8I3S7Z0_CANLF|nr:heparan-sulfate 6-O-sulfotransferase 2 isoform X1 [Canis lupus familiaris]XP_035567789.1 heparan-sulfate 6-O-sulfotransferase 2 isoform X2 [Canis lupus dingo]XP_038306812.1 heparan-sulfate 6-O-sulfotransferase 2 isoform X1 [Canis lupus familiaris]XP_038444259.1 heparan-sulfate 6-O-sulfotransferase 2 isoform X1 [Canis lupus familiaris]|eukprot:XP_005641885.1 heparan-sulfate 6-O-sulfotransferase 2 isoform X2 [Canis lupus familiaris]